MNQQLQYQNVRDQSRPLLQLQAIELVERAVALDFIRVRRSSTTPHALAAERREMARTLQTSAETQ